MEQSVKNEFDEIGTKLTPEEKKGRVDIKYKTTSGKHVIIELKRPNIRLSEATLVTQVDKYKRALVKLLDDRGIKEPVEIVCIVGEPLTDWDTPQNKEISRRAMAERSIRVVNYKQLIHNANLTYREFVKKREEAGRVYRLVKNIDTEVPEID